MYLYYILLRFLYFYNNMESKICSGCKVNLSVDNFHKRLDGLAPQCKACAKSKNKGGERNLAVEYNTCRECNMTKDADEFVSNKWLKNGIHSECITCTTNKYNNMSNKAGKNCSKCKEVKAFIYFSKSLKTVDGYRSQCKACVREYNILTTHKRILYRKKYLGLNKETVYKKDILAKSKKRKFDSFFRLKAIVRTLIGNSFKKNLKNPLFKSKKSQDILGCTFEEFKLHIESQFLSWMNWENQGNKCKGMEYNCSWDLDHIIPISVAKTEEDIYLLNHWSNFQPLCSKINRWEKIDKIPLCSNIIVDLNYLTSKVKTW